MTFHSRSKRGRVDGPKRVNALGHLLKPRISITLPENDFRDLNWLAAKKGKPIAEIMRDAVWAYLLPFRNNPSLKKDSQP